MPPKKRKAQTKLSQTTTSGQPKAKAAKHGRYDDYVLIIQIQKIYIIIINLWFSIFFLIKFVFSWKLKDYYKLHIHILYISK